MTKASKIKRTLCIIFMLFLFSGKSSEIPQQQATGLLRNIWRHMISSDIIMTDIRSTSYHGEGETFYGTGQTCPNN